MTNPNNYRTICHKIGRWVSALRGGDDQAGQALPIVLGLTLMIFLGTLTLITNVSQHYPIIEQDVLQHEAYRAMQAGINTYTSEANLNPDYVMCNAYVYSGTTYVSSSNNNMTQIGNPTSRSLPSGLCTGPTVGAWTTVPNLATTKGPPAYFLYGSPTVYYCGPATPGGTSNCPESVWVSMKIVGASGFNSKTYYDTGTVSFVPSNSFLLNLWWLNYDQEDPATLLSQLSWGGTYTTPNCTYAYTNNPAAVNSGCEAVDFITGETLDGDIFDNDTVFLCGSPTINGVIDTADSAITREDGCTGSVSGTTTGSQDNLSREPVPTDDAILGQVAATGGCLYQGPTEIKLASQTVGSTTTWGMDVYSPETASPYTSANASSYTGGRNDSNDASSNASECINPTGYGFVPYPTNGVVFVENCTVSNTSCTSTSTWNPLSVYGSDIDGTSSGQYIQYITPSQGQGGQQLGVQQLQYGSYGPTEGDAIVEGNVQGPLTIAAENNVVIVGDLCYTSWIQNTTNAWSLSGTFSSCNNAPATQSTADVLGLVAYNYIEVGHPIYCSGGTASASGTLSSCSNQGTCTNEPVCPVIGGTELGATLGPSGSLNCVLDPTSQGNGGSCGQGDAGNIYVDAAVLALNGQFWVNSDDEGCPMGDLDIQGSISEDWRGPVGTFSGSTASTGYTKIYTYDQRLGYLSPPQYLNPGTASWDLGSISSTIGPCPSTMTGCSTVP